MGYLPLQGSVGLSVAAMHSRSHHSPVAVVRGLHWGTDSLVPQGCWILAPPNSANVNGKNVPPKYSLGGNVFD